MRIDVSDLITDPDFCQDFTVYRRARAADDKGRAEVVETAEVVTGVIQPLSGDDLDRLPEGDRGKQAISVWTLVPITTGDGGKLPDEVEWRGTRYTAIGPLHNWGDWGEGYYRAACVAQDMRDG